MAATNYSALSSDEMKSDEMRAMNAVEIKTSHWICRIHSIEVSIEHQLVTERPTDRQTYQGDSAGLAL